MSRLLLLLDDPDEAGWALDPPLVRELGRPVLTFADDALAGSPTKAASAWQRATPAAPHPDSEEGRRRMESLATLTPQEAGHAAG